MDIPPNEGVSKSYKTQGLPRVLHDFDQCYQDPAPFNGDMNGLVRVLVDVM